MSSPRATRSRLDAVLAERGLFGSRSAAAAAVRAGEVRIGADGPVALRPSQLIDADAELLIADEIRYVSRGAYKLANAVQALGIEIAGRDCLDVGASTGGFTDFMLQSNAARVCAADVAYGQIDWGLRNNERVVVIERLNAREMRPEDLPFVPNLTTIDVSFISLGKVLPAVARCVEPGSEILAMVKPQFELGRKRVGRGGVVRSPEDRLDAVLGVAKAAGELGLVVTGFAASGLAGPKGNLETFVLCGGAGEPLVDLEGEAEKAVLVT